MELHSYTAWTRWTWYKHAISMVVVFSISFSLSLSPPPSLSLYPSYTQHHTYSQHVLPNTQTNLLRLQTQQQWLLQKRHRPIHNLPYSAVKPCHSIDTISSLPNQLLVYCCSSTSGWLLFKALYTFKEKCSHVADVY